MGLLTNLQVIPLWDCSFSHKCHTSRCFQNTVFSNLHWGENYDIWTYWTTPKRIFKPLEVWGLMNYHLMMASKLVYNPLNGEIMMQLRLRRSSQFVGRRVPASYFRYLPAMQKYHQWFPWITSLYPRHLHGFVFHGWLFGANFCDDSLVASLPPVPLHCKWTLLHKMQVPSRKAWCLLHPQTPSWRVPNWPRWLWCLAAYLRSESVKSLGGCLTWLVDLLAIHSISQGHCWSCYCPVVGWFAICLLTNESLSHWNAESGILTCSFTESSINESIRSVFPQSLVSYCFRVRSPNYFVGSFSHRFR